MVYSIELLAHNIKQSLKIVQKCDLIFHQKINTESMYAPDKMLNVIIHQVKASKNHNVKLLHNYGIVEIRLTDNTQGWCHRVAIGALLRCWWECTMLQPRWKHWQFLIKLNIQFTMPSSTPTPRNLPKNNNTFVHTKIYK